MRLRTFAQAVLYSLASLVLLVTVLLLAAKFTLDRAPRYQAEIKEWVHRQTGYHIGFASVSPEFRLNGPELYFKRLELRSKDDRRVLARAASGRIALDIRELVRSGRLLAGRIEVVGAEIAVDRSGPTRFAVGGEIEFGGAHADLSKVLIDDFPVGRVAIRNATLRLNNWNETLPELTVHNFDLELRRDGSGAAVVLKGEFPPVLGGPFTARAGVRGHGALATASWRGAVHARDVSFPGLRQALPELLSSLDAGSGEFELEAGGRGADFDDATLKINAVGVATRLPDGPVAKFDEIGGLLDVKHAGGLWTLRGTHLRTSPHDPESTVDVSWSAAQPGAFDVRAQASYLRVETLLPLVVFLPQRDVRERLLAIAPTGEWTGTRIAVARAAADAPLNLEVQATFHDAGFAPLGRAPGLRGLSGSIAGDQSGGHLFIDTDSAVYNWPAQFTAPIELRKLAAKLYWSRTPDELLVAGRDWEVATQDAAMHGKIAWQQPADGSSPLLTLVSRVGSGEIANAKKYFPRALLPPPALKWLDRAFLAGRLTHADTMIRGPMRRFPFRDGSGLFLVRTAVESMTLDYSDGWPVAENVDAQAEFRNEGVTVRLLRGRMGEVAIDGGEARFVDFKTGELKLALDGKGDAAAAISYLRATPLDALAEHLFSSVECSGPMEANVDLVLPFKDFAHRRVLVHSRLNGATLTRVGWQHRATDLRGDFDIDGAHVAKADIQGQLLGGAFQMQARTPRTRPLTRTQLEFRGSARADAFRETFALPPTLGIAGQTEWHGVLKIANEPARERSLRLSSSLTGFELRLPAPLDKRAEEALPSWLEIQWPATGGPLGRFALGSIVNGAYSLDSDAASMRLARLTLLFGDEQAGAGDAQQIVNIRGGADRVDLAGWLKFNTPGKDAKPLSYWLRNAQLQVGELDYLGLAFRDVALKLWAGEVMTRIDVGGPNVDGVISIPAGGTDPWSLQFQKVNFEVAESAAAPAGAAPDVIGPRSVPALDFHAAQLVWGERHFGDVKATLTKLEDGVSLQSLSVSAPSLTVKARGEWRGNGPGISRIQGSLDSSDVQDTLKALGYADVLQARGGKVEFDLNWNGAPSSEALSQVAGHVQLAFDKGQLTGIKPGAGRVLGLTSFAALPRHLSLDFSDLTDKGLAFDTVRGSFDLRAGNAYTDDVLLQGPAAEIGLIGRIGLKNKDYDQTAVVTGSVGTALPLAAFAGGPVVGAAVLLFTQVFKEPLKGLARGYYRITGSWDNPTVERIKNADAAAASAEVPK